MREIVHDAVKDTLKVLVPENINRVWYMEYLFKYTFGDKLPRCKKFNKLKFINDRKEWPSFFKEINYEFNNPALKQKVSPFLLRQKALLSLAVIHELCEFNVDYITEVIKKLEGLGSTKTTDLIKYNVPFKKNGLLKDYIHHHVPLLPNSYMAMLAKEDPRGNIINLGAIADSISFPNGKYNFDLNSLEKGIASRGANKGGRLTGHWLISKVIGGENIYLGCFPHSNGKHDDHWIKRQLLESERVYMRTKAHNKRLL